MAAITDKRYLRYDVFNAILRHFGHKNVPMAGYLQSWDACGTALSHQLAHDLAQNPTEDSCHYAQEG